MVPPWVIDWLLRIFYRYIESGILPENSSAACIVPLSKGKGGRRDLANYWEISISILGKIYRRVLISSGGKY